MASGMAMALLCLPPVKRMATVMAKQSKKFLQCWISRYIEGQHRHPENIEHTLGECISDASLKGIAKKDLEDAADGDLRNFLLAEIMKAQKP